MTKINKEDSLSTEERIKQAAITVFTKKGYAATTTRDIASEAGINTALLNYYYRSKEKLFNIIMNERIERLFVSVRPVFNDESLTLDQKIDRICCGYIDIATEDANLPIFVLNEIKNDPEPFIRKIGLESIVGSSHFVKQIRERKPGIDPTHILLTMFGMLLFPFAIQPAFVSSGIYSETQYRKLMEQRRELVPEWVRKILSPE